MASLDPEFEVVGQSSLSTDWASVDLCDSKATKAIKLVTKVHLHHVAIQISFSFRLDSTSQTRTLYYGLSTGLKPNELLLTSGSLKGKPLKQLNL